MNLKYWLDLLKSVSEEEIMIALMGNKVDIMFRDPDKREVSKKMADKFARDNGLLFMGESSALADINVHEIIDRLLNSMSIIRDI